MKRSCTHVLIIIKITNNFNKHLIVLTIFEISNKWFDSTARGGGGGIRGEITIELSKREKNGK